MAGFRHLVCLTVILSVTLIPRLVVAEGNLSGHWESTSVVFGTEVQMNIDLVQQQDGSYIGTISQPGDGIRHIPLLSATLDNQLVLIIAREDQPFTGQISTDGSRIAGSMSVAGYEIPLTLIRNGDAQLPAHVSSPAVAAAFEGIWQGSLAGTQAEMTIVNHSDGTVSAKIINLSQGNMTIPAAEVTSEGNILNLNLSAISGSYTGQLNGDNTVIAGTFTQGGMRMPLDFRK